MKTRLGARLEALEVKRGQTPADIPPHLLNALNEALESEDEATIAELLGILAPDGLTVTQLNHIDRQLQKELNG